MINIIISLIASSVVGLFCLALFVDGRLLLTVSLALALVVAVDIVFILYNAQFFKIVIRAMNKIFNRNVNYYHLSSALTIRLHLLHLLAALAFGTGAFLLAVGIGFDLAAVEALPIMAAMIISDVIGFLAVFVPGGLGVREGVMYYLLNGSSMVNLALILPLAIRVIHMLVDLCKNEKALNGPTD